MTTKPEGYARCGNHVSRFTTYFHASAADVRSCYILKTNGMDQEFLDTLADHVAPKR